MRKWFKYSILAITVISFLALSVKGVCSCCPDCLIETPADNLSSCCSSNEEDCCEDAPCVITSISDANHIVLSFSWVAIAPSFTLLSGLFTIPATSRETLNTDKPFAPTPRDHLLKLRVLII